MKMINYPQYRPYDEDSEWDRSCLEDESKSISKRITRLRRQRIKLRGILVPMFFSPVFTSLGWKISAKKKKLKK